MKKENDISINNVDNIACEIDDLIIEIPTVKKIKLALSKATRLEFDRGDFLKEDEV